MIDGEVVGKLLSSQMEMQQTWTETEDVSSVGLGPGQHREEAQVQDVLHRGRLQVLEHLGPGFTTRVVIEQQLQRAVVVELPGPQEAEEEGVVQPGPEVRLFLQSQVSRKEK